ncbi:unnamed protein product, partial [marine sediment metagenome]
ASRELNSIATQLIEDLDPLRKAFLTRSRDECLKHPPSYFTL